MRIVLEGLRGEMRIAELCRKESTAAIRPEHVSEAIQYRSLDRTLDREFPE
jgi:hypothetical protein